jgi:hypothetical protein
MVRFTEEDKMLLYITRAKAEELETGSWDDCTAIFNRLASKPRTQDALTATYRSLKDNSKLEMRAGEATWSAVKEQVERWLREASPMHHFPRERS